jgi:hypothetical protein
MSALVTATAQTDTIGIVFSWIILLPGLATGLIIVAMVTAKGEKAEDEALSVRWGRRTARSDD